MEPLTQMLQGSALRSWLWPYFLSDLLCGQFCCLPVCSSEEKSFSALNLFSSHFSLRLLS